MKTAECVSSSQVFRSLPSISVAAEALVIKDRMEAPFLLGDVEGTDLGLVNVEILEHVNLRQDQRILSLQEVTHVGPIVADCSPRQ